MNLIVRVKRRRSQDPSESLWIVDDAGGVQSRKKTTTRHITEGLDKLSTITGESNQERSESINHKLFLKRVQTVEVGAESELDKSSLSASVSKSQKRDRSEIEPSRESNDVEPPTETSKDSTESALDAVNSRAGSKQSSSMWITSGKKVLRSSYTLEKFVVVDVTQIPFTRPSTISSKSLGKGSLTGAASSSVAFNASNLPQNTPKKSAVVDPATRKLDAAIEKALKLNDFNEMAQALQIGANINYQRTSDGMTALMVASLQKNNRMVSRLIAKGSDVFLVDHSGRTAMDHVKKNHNQSHTGNSHLQNASVEISLLLHRTAVTAQQLANRKQRRSDEEEEAMREPNNIDPALCANLGLVQTGNSEIMNIVNNSGNLGNSENNKIGENNENGIKNVDDETNNEELSTIKDDDTDYVVDIYLQQSEQPTDTSINMNNTKNSDISKDVMMDTRTTHTFSGSTDPGYHIPVVQVDGLHIKNNGNVELVFEYDSDWSDLADDEDPDSNDERFQGNDYPEEGAEDYEEREEDEDSEDEEKYAMLRADIEDRQEGGYEQRNVGQNSKDMEENSIMSGLDYGFSGGNGSSRRINRFSRNSVGRVLRPHTIDETGEEGETISGRDSKALQALWGLSGDGNGDNSEDDDDEDDDDDNVAANSRFRNDRKEHGERLQNMRAGTGMQFAANPREFTRFGMPKYGADLSDDENDVEPYENILEDDTRHSKVTFATSTSTSDNTASRPGIPSYCKVIPSQSRNTPSKPNQAGIDRMAMIRNEVRETASSRARGDLTGDLDGVGYFSKSGISSSRSRGSDLFRPLRTTVAYDSELDMESSDESDGNT